MRGQIRNIVIGAGLLVSVAGCDVFGTKEIGAEIDEGGFGNPTMNNVMVQTGQKPYAIELTNKFASQVPATVNFAFNSSALDAEAEAALRQQADWIRQFPEVRFRVFGYTDLVGTESYNKSLGMRRARAVVAYLASQGISTKRLQAVVSYGETRPLVPTPAPERQNRRAVTEVSGFVQNHPLVLNGKYAEVIFREYVKSAEAKIVTTTKTSATLTPTGN